MPGEIEFLGDGGGQERPDDEQLEQGPRQRWPRWVVAVGVMVVAGAVVAAITLHGGGRPQAAATTSVAPTATPSDRGSGVVPLPAVTAPTATPSVPNSALTASISHVMGDIEAIAVVGDDAVVLASGSLVRVSEDDRGDLYPHGGSTAGLPFGDPRESNWTLISDGYGLWVVSSSGRIRRVDASSLRIGPLIWQRMGSGPGGAAALDGHLYVNTDVGVYDLAPSARTLSKQPVTRGGRAIAADPTRHRLLLLDHDGGWAIRAYSPAKNKTVAGRALPFNARSLAVADGAIWVAGTSSGADPTPVLARLDPTTLRVVGRSTLGPRPQRVPTLIAGQTDLWVRSWRQLWCVNARTGAVAQHWPVLPGKIASRDGHAFIADGGLVGLLRLNHACTG